MRINCLLHGRTVNNFTRKNGEKVAEPVGIIADASEFSRCLQFFEVRGEEILNGWKEGTCRLIDVLEMKQTFSGRIHFSNASVVNTGKA